MHRRGGDKAGPGVCASISLCRLAFIYLVRPLSPQLAVNKVRPTSRLSQLFFSEGAAKVAKVHGATMKSLPPQARYPRWAQQSLVESRGCSSALGSQPFSLVVRCFCHSLVSQAPSQRRSRTAVVFGLACKASLSACGWAFYECEVVSHLQCDLHTRVQTPRKVNSHQWTSSRSATSSGADYYALNPLAPAKVSFRFSVTVFQCEAEEWTCFELVAVYLYALLSVWGDSLVVSPAPPVEASPLTLSCYCWQTELRAFNLRPGHADQLCLRHAASLWIGWQQLILHVVCKSLRRCYILVLFRKSVRVCLRDRLVSKCYMQNLCTF